MNKSFFNTLCLICIIGFLAAITVPMFTNRDNRVIVNMPADAKPLETLKTDYQIIGPEKAVLWWTVYKATLDKGWAPNTAKDNANSAVEKVYGR